MKKINRTTTALIIIGVFMNIMDIYFNTFLVARLFELADNSTNVIAKYYIIVYTAIAVTFVLLGNLSKKHSTAILRIGILLNAIILILIMALDDTVIKVYELIAIIFGFAQGCYYSPYSNIVSVNITSKAESTVKEFCTISNILANVVSIIFPVTIGVYLSVASFKQMSIFIFGLIVLQLATTMLIQNVSSEKKYDLKSFLNKIKQSQSGRKVLNYYKVSFCNGIVSSVLDRTITILILMLYKTTFNLGILSTIFATSTIIITWAVKKFYKRKRIRISIIISAIMPSIAVIVLAVNVNTVTFVIYKLVSAIFICILSTLAGYARYECLDKSTFSNFDAEHQSMCELSLALGRISGFCALLLCSNLFVGIEAIRIFLIVIGVIIVFYARNVYKTVE